MANLQNGLLAALQAEDYALIDPHLERVTLAQREILHEPGQPISHAYFFEGGLSSEIAVNSDGNQIEVGCIGREGLSGIPAVLGVERASHQAFMQAGGSALRIRIADLRDTMDASRSLRDLLLRYAHVFMIQIAATALSDGRYHVEQRLARWLLMAHDRLGDVELPLTHDFLALMLGIRRPGVTNATHTLEGQHLIKGRRSRITVLDRPGLEEVAGASYGKPEAEYERLIGSK